MSNGLTLTELALLRTDTALQNTARQRDVLAAALREITEMTLDEGDAERGRYQLPKMRKIAEEALASLAELQNE